MTKVNGAVALVTGGNRGLGKAFVAELLARGATKVYATARTPAASDDPRVVPLALELTDPASVAALAERVGDVQIVVNNAGVYGGKPLLDADVEQVREVFDTNVFGPLRVVRALAPALAANGGGALVNVASILSWLPGSGAYGASKAALWSLTNSLRLELAERGTQVVGVHVGYIDTEMARTVTSPKLDPREVAATVLDGLESGAHEVLVDEVTRRVKAQLAGPAEGLGRGN